MRLRAENRFAASFFCVCVKGGDDVQELKKRKSDSQSVKERFIRSKALKVRSVLAENQTPGRVH